MSYSLASQNIIVENCQSFIVQTAQFKVHKVQNNNNNINKIKSYMVKLNFTFHRVFSANSKVPMLLAKYKIYRLDLIRLGQIHQNTKKFQDVLLVKCDCIFIVIFFDSTFSF